MILWIITFLITFVGSMISPAVPYLVKEFVITEEAVAVIMGLLISVGAIATMLSNIFGGVVADKVGRKKLVFLSICIYAPALLLYLLSMDWLWLVFASLIASVPIGLSQPSFNALIADLIPKTKRATAYGIYNVSSLLGQIPSPIIGGYLAIQMGIRSPFLIGLIPFLLAILFALKIVEPKLKRPFLSQPIHDQRFYSPTIPPFKMVVPIFCGMRLFSGLANGILFAVIPTYLIFKLNADVLQLGMATSIGIALVSAAVQIPGGKLADKVGRKKVMLLSVLASPLVMAISYTQDLIQFIAILGLICAVGNLSSPAFTALLMDLVSSDKRAKASGFSQAAFGAGMIIGPVLGGLLWSVFKPETFMPFLISSAMFFSMAPFILLLKEPATETRTGAR